MYIIHKTDEFISWLTKLKDLKAKAKIAIRITRVEDGVFGDHRILGKGLAELKIDFGPGYRLYYTIEKAESRPKCNTTISYMVLQWETNTASYLTTSVMA